MKFKWLEDKYRVHNKNRTLQCLHCEQTMTFPSVKWVSNHVTCNRQTTLEEFNE